MNTLRAFAIFSVAALVAGCVNLSGPSGEGNGSETIAKGVIVDSAGTPMAGVPVQLLPADFDPAAPDTIPQGWRSFTNNKGQYRLTGIRAGAYTLEASSLSSGMKALVGAIVLSGRNVEAVLDTGRLARTATVHIPLQSVAPRVGAYVYLPGTSTYAIVTRSDSAIGRITLTGVPAGSFARIVYKEATDSQGADLLADTLTIRPGDTVVSTYSAWKYSRKILLNTTVSGAGISNNIFNFPVLVRLSSATFAFTQAQDSGTDIRFSRVDGIALPHEIERWDPVSGRAEVWVIVDTIYGNNGTQSITMYWGNPHAHDIAPKGAIFDTSNGFIGVWHLGEPPVGNGQLRDRTVNAHHATPYGGMSAMNSVEGMIGKALAFDGVDDYVNAGDVSIPGTYTMSLWVRLDTVEKSQRFIYRDSSYTLWYAYDTTHSVRVEHMSETAWWRGLLQDGGTRVPMAAGAWYYLVGTFDGSRITLYVNGVEASRSNVITALPVRPPGELWFGKYRRNIDFVRGIMDEIRIEGVARSAEWIKLSYMNQRPNNTFVVLQ